MAGVAFKLNDWGDRTSGRAFGIGVTVADGTWLVGGIPEGAYLQLVVPEVASTWRSTTKLPLFGTPPTMVPVTANGTLDLGDIPLEHFLTVEPPSASSIVAGRTITLRWAAIPGASVYCVRFSDNNYFYGRSTCGSGNDSWVEVRDTQWTTTPLAAGQTYHVSVSAFARTDVAATNYRLGVGGVTFSVH